MMKPESRKSIWMRRFFVGVTLVVAAGAVFAMFFLKSTPDARKTVQTVQVLRLPPPPPPKPPEKPPEPPPPQEKIKIETPTPQQTPTPEPQQSAPPPGPIGLDAQGSGPGDGFGLAGRPGGTEIKLGGGPVGGGTNLAMTTFANGAARFIAQELARNEQLKRLSYRVELRVWLSADGQFERYELIKGSGDANVDKMIRDGLSQMSPYRAAVPEGLMQPLRVRVTSADA